MTYAEKHLRDLFSKAVRHPDVTSYQVVNEGIFNPNRQDSIWFDGELLNITYQNRFIFSIYTGGDTTVSCKAKHDYCDSAYEMTDWLEIHGVKNDEDLKEALARERISIDYGNWFEFALFDMKEKFYLDFSDFSWYAEPACINSNEIVGWIHDYLKNMVKDEARRATAPAVYWDVALLEEEII